MPHKTKGKKQQPSGDGKESLTSLLSRYVQNKDYPDQNLFTPEEVEYELLPSIAEELLKLDDAKRAATHAANKSKEATTL